jgi:hypothetical protein
MDDTRLGLWAVVPSAWFAVVFVGGGSESADSVAMVKDSRSGITSSSGEPTGSSLVTGWGRGWGGTLGVLGVPASLCE